MNSLDILNKHISDMHQFQKKYNIVNYCSANSILLHRFAKCYNINIKIVCGFIFRENRGVVHCWCEYEGIILEPSLQYYQKGFTYFSSFGKFCKCVKLQKTKAKEFITERNKFEININKFVVDDFRQHEYFYQFHCWWIKKNNT